MHTPHIHHPPWLVAGRRRGVFASSSISTITPIIPIIAMLQSMLDLPYRSSILSKETRAR